MAPMTQMWQDLGTSHKYFDDVSECFTTLNVMQAIVNDYKGDLRPVSACRGARRYRIANPNVSPNVPEAGSKCGNGGQYVVEYGNNISLDASLGMFYKVFTPSLKQHIYR